MYSEWTSVEHEVRDIRKCTSVLHNYPPSVGRDVAKSVVSSLLGGSTSISGNKTPDLSSTPRLIADSEVKWSMEVICFGLSLTLFEHDTLKDSVNVYVDWLSVLTNPKSNVPEPIRRDPMPYARIMINHLQNLFIPRSDGSPVAQARLCQTVLRSVQTIAQNSDHLDRETWETLLMFTLNVCEFLLAAPTQLNGLAESLCELLMQTLMQVWLLSCVNFFPSPPLWKTAMLLFARWRHHPPVVEYWCKVTSALTARYRIFFMIPLWNQELALAGRAFQEFSERVVAIMHGPSYPKMKIPEDDMKFVPSNMTKEVVMQTWFRMLHLINNPVDLSNSTALIKGCPRFYEVALTRDGVQDPTQHPTLSVLPGIFLKALRGISDHVDGLLGISSHKRLEIVYFNNVTKTINPETPLNNRKAQKGASRKQQPSTISLQSKNVQGSAQLPKYNSSPNVSGPPPSINAVSSSIDMHPKAAKDRPQVNSVLHLYGQWLFDAALAGVKVESQLARERGGSFTARGRSSSGILPTSTSTGPASSASLQSQDSLSSNLFPDVAEGVESFDAGRSAASGTLCRIFSCKKTGEHILPVYLSRFYLTVSHGLYGDSHQVLASILLNSVNLFRMDLPGVTCLLPAMLSALETILPDKELGQFRPYVNITELRRASIHLLLSMIPLALHYDNLAIEDIQSLWCEGDDSGSSNQTGAKYTFRSLKLRIIQQLIGALQCETDSVNTQMILGGMLLALQDFALFESAEDDDLENGPLKKTSDNGSVSSDTAYGFFVSCVHLVSQKLESSKSELTVSLAALELLAGLAKAKVKIADSDECRRAVSELCRYIISQCERPPPHHKRELHSMIVAAFHTLTTWLLEHPYLLDEKNCLHEVLEIIELGISGSKSSPGRRGSGVSSNTAQQGANKATLKGEKDLNPASMRVLEAAEGALLCVFEHLGAFPSPCSPSSTCSLLNELSLVMRASGYTPTSINQSDDVDENPGLDNQSTTQTISSPANQLNFAEAIKKFKYFVVRNTVLLGILEQNLGNEQEPVPTVTMVIRSAGGRKAYAMQFKQTAESEKQPAGSYLTCAPRPKPDLNPGVHHNVRHRTFPPEVDCIPLVNADCSIPLLSDVPDQAQAEKLKKIQALIEEQKQYDIKVEKRLQQALSEEGDPLSLKMKECVPPKPAQEFQTARLFLSHLNLLTLNSVKHHPHQRLGPDLVILNRLDPDFPADLEDLDAIPVRNNDTVFIFYHKAGQSTKQEILENTSLRCSELRPEFTEFVLSLGWPVDLKTHPGWTGQTTTSWKVNHSQSSGKVVDLNTESLGIFNGEKYILYHADVLTEVAFIIPTRTPIPANVDLLTEVDGDAMDESVREKLQLDLSSVHSSGSMNSNESPGSPTGPLPGTKTKKSSSASRANLQQLPDCRVAVIWTESYDGIDDFPLEQLLSEMHTGQESIISANPSRKDMLAIFIHPLENGLFSITVNGQTNAKSGMAVPLVSGAIVSRRALGPAVRMTASNMCHRRRLDSDGYSPPHIKRKHRITELLTRYQRRCTEPDFFTAVFAEQHVTKPVLPDRILAGAPQGSPTYPLPSNAKRTLTVP